MEVEGKIKFVNQDKGFCFITVEPELDVFAHVSDFQDREVFPQLREGQEVAFTVDEGRDGRFKAIDVVIVE